MRITSLLFLTLFYCISAFSQVHLTRKEDFGENPGNLLCFMHLPDSEKIIFFKFHDIGHAIPIDTDNGELSGGKKGMFAKDIDFYSTYYIAKEFGIIIN